MLKLMEFTEDNIDEYMEFAIDSYSSNNPFFINGLTNAESWKEITKKLITLFI